MQSITICQSDNFPPDSLYPVEVNSEIWYAMPKARLARIANERDSVKRLANAFPGLDSALTACNGMVAGQRKELLSYRELMLNYDESERKFESIISEREKLLFDANRTIQVLDTQNKKLIRRNKTTLILGGVVATIMTGVVIALSIR
jgi:hypothetical protein